MRVLKLCMLPAVLWSISGAVPLSAQDATTTDETAPASVLTERQPLKWAVLIGVDDYAGLGDNRYCSRDIQALRARLIAGGFPVTNVFVLHNDAGQGKYLPSKANIERQLELIPALTGPEDLIVVGFCGHAVEVGGEGYLCPIEADPAAPDKTLVSLDYVYRQLGGAPARHKLLLTDVGRNSIGTEPDTVEEFLTALQRAPKGVSVLAGCGVNNVPQEDDQLGGGLFWHELLEGIGSKADQDVSEPDERVSLGELVDYVRSKTGGEAMRGRVRQPVFVGEETEVVLALVPKFAPEMEYYPTVQGDRGEASARLEAMIRVNPRSLGAYNQALISYGHGDIMEAIDYCNDAIRYDPGNTCAHILRASCHSAYGNLAKAVEGYNNLGIPLPCFVISKTAQLKIGDEIVAELSQGSKLYVTKAEGEWLSARFTQGEDVKEGWIHQTDVD